MPHILAKSLSQSEELVLVLGRDFIADQIGNQLRVEGFEVVLERDLGQLLPSPEEDGSIEQLRSFLNVFAKASSEVNQRWIHPGISRWARRPELFLLAKEFGIQIFGPSAKVVSLFADQLSFLELASKVDIPTLLLHSEPVASAREIMAAMQGLNNDGLNVHFPIVVKSIRGGGGGPGFFVVHDSQGLNRKFSIWKEQVEQNVGEAIFFLERYLEDSRRILVPFVRFSNGDVVTLPKVDCSLQHQHREILSFCPAFGVDADVETHLETWTKRYASECQFTGVGVLEYLVDGDRAYLIDGKPGLNPNYSLWDSASRYHAVSWQLASLLNEKLPFPAQDQDKGGVSVSIQIYSENPFLEVPVPGVVHSLELPRHYHGVFEWSKAQARIESGESIDASSDGLVAVVLAHSKDRKAAIELLGKTLKSIWVSGSLQTNERFIHELLDHPWVQEGIFHSSFIEEEFIPQWDPPQAVLELFAWISSQAGRFIGRGHPSGIYQVGKQKQSVQGLRLHWEGQPEFWKKGSLGGIEARVKASDGEVYRVSAYPLALGEWQVRVGSWWAFVREVKPEPMNHRVLVAQTNGQIYSRYYQEGSRVPAHEPLAMIYCLRTLVPQSLPLEVEIKKWHVKSGSSVRVGQKLLEWAPVHMKDGHDD